MKAFLAMVSTRIFWQKSKKIVPYPTAITWMRQYVQNIYHEKAPECLWFLEHAPLYSAGTSAKKEDLFNPQNFPVFYTNRGGQWTYHGPGMRIIYVMIDLRRPHPSFPDHDIRAFVHHLENWLILTLQYFGITAEKRKDRIGLWVVDPLTKQEEKIAALGIKLNHWISWHGIALNVYPTLENYAGIIPCGLKNYGVTSMHKLKVHASMTEVDQILCKKWNESFGEPLIQRPLPLELMNDQDR